MSPLTHLVATIFVTFAIVSVGLVGAFEWDALAFDQRDGMVLGALPVSWRTIVAAKLAALGALLLIAASGINVLTALPFSFIATTRQPLIATIRLFAAHLVTTMSASTFVFCILVTIRAINDVFGRGRIVIGTLLHLGLVSALLCFIVFTPTALQLDVSRIPHRPTRVVAVHMQPIPPWSPTHYFVGLYDVVRGAPQTESQHQALIALSMTLASATAAIVTVILGYRRQLRLALSPVSAAGVVAVTRVPRLLARALAGRRRPAQAFADFIVVTLVRNRAQQAPVAINAALGVVAVVLELTRRRTDFAGAFHPTMALSRVPFLLAFWFAVGLRASFFVPSELPAAWTFHTNAAQGTWGSHRAICGAGATLLVLPIAALTFILSVSVSDWNAALWHAIFAAVGIQIIPDIAGDRPAIGAKRKRGGKVLRMLRVIDISNTSDERADSRGSRPRGGCPSGQ